MKGNKSAKKTSVVDTAYGKHRVVFERDARKGYTAIAPDLEGVITWGRNLAHAKEMIKEAIELCIECIAEERIATEKMTLSARARRSREQVLV